uniref:Cytochrome c-553 n=1 Tax=Tolypiocladia glomerulata TaxID=860646 RepID=A0A1Z1MUZ3_9FLOR|nr:cytochrome c553 [Tolypiocladia glomerulata]ARW69652.1 cytochrome c553 [Tolypiocladia glomerulata]
MKFLLSLILSFFTLLFISNSSVLSEGLSVDLDAGEQVFSQNCVSCHAGGANLVNPEKTLSIEDLHKYSRDNLEAIIYQVTNGGNGMPRFGENLSDEQILNVASYVFSQAKNSAW